MKRNYSKMWNIFSVCFPLTSFTIQLCSPEMKKRGEATIEETGFRIIAVLEKYPHTFDEEDQDKFKESLRKFLYSNFDFPEKEVETEVKGEKRKEGIVMKFDTNNRKMLIIDGTYGKALHEEKFPDDYVEESWISPPTNPGEGLSALAGPTPHVQ